MVQRLDYRCATLRTLERAAPSTVTSSAAERSATEQPDTAASALTRLRASPSPRRPRQRAGASARRRRGTVPRPPAQAAAHVGAVEHDRVGWAHGTDTERGLTGARDAAHEHGAVAGASSSTLWPAACTCFAASNDARDSGVYAGIHSRHAVDGGHWLGPAVVQSPPVRSVARDKRADGPEQRPALSRRPSAPSRHRPYALAESGPRACGRRRCRSDRGSAAGGAPALARGRLR